MDDEIKVKKTLKMTAVNKVALIRLDGVKSHK